MKRLTSITLAIVLLFAFSVNVMAQTREYIFTDAIRGASEQGPDWHFMVSRAGAEFQELHHTPAWGDNWQYSLTPGADGIFHSIAYGNGIAFAWVGWSQGDRFDIAARFTIPETGTWTIPSWRHMFVHYGTIWLGDAGWVVTNTNDGIIDAVIRLGDTELYRGTSNPRYMIYNEPITFEANAGDYVWFIVEPHEGADGPVFMSDIGLAFGDTPPVTPAMTLDLPPPQLPFGGDGVFSLRDSYIGATEHGPDWFWLSRYGDGDWQEMTFWDEWGGNNWQYTTNPHYYQIWFSMFDWNGVAAATGFDILTRNPVEMAAAFRAPQSGTLRIGPWQHVDFEYTWWDGPVIVLNANQGSNPSAVEIRHNNITLYFQRLSGGMQVSPEISVDVQEGDMIYFIVRPMELESVEAGDTRVRMDDILLTFDPNVDFAVHLARMPQIRAEALPDPPSQPGDPVPGEDRDAVEATPEPTPAETPAPTPEPPAPTPEAPIDDEGTSIPWVVIPIVSTVLATVIIIIIVIKKKK